MKRTYLPKQDNLNSDDKNLQKMGDYSLTLDIRIELQLLSMLVC